ncbi:hypothetical protein, partial [Herbaspirillum robiniae]|uniref:hypothetical protein n=1 Tax=Herbaspirillum robiniae TaxID=2014887 RepID=UPI001C2F5401
EGSTFGAKGGSVFNAIAHYFELHFIKVLRLSSPLSHVIYGGFTQRFYSTSASIPLTLGAQDAIYFPNTPNR